MLQMSIKIFNLQNSRSLLNLYGFVCELYEKLRHRVIESFGVARVLFLSDLLEKKGQVHTLVVRISVQEVEFRIGLETEKLHFYDAISITVFS